MTGALIMTTTLPTIIAMGVVVETVRRVFPKQGQGTGKATRHWHYMGKSKNKAVQHAHPGGHLIHKHKGMPGYGRTLKRLKR